MLDQLLDIARVDGIHHVEEVLSCWQASLGDLVREVLHELVDALHVWPQIFDRKLVVVRHCHHLDVTEWHERFLLSEDLSQKICRRNECMTFQLTFVDHQLWWDIKLKLISEVIKEIVFAVEAVSDLIGQDSPLAKNLRTRVTHVCLNHG